jgi:hypothetical protein
LRRAPIFVLIALAGAACDSGSSGGSPFSLTVTQSVNGTSQAISGVAVALDEGDGTRFEGTTNADGVVSFPAVDLSRGPFAFTAAAPGFVAVSDLGMTQTGGWHLTLSPVGSDPTWADVSGSVEGKMDPDDYLYVTASIPSLGFSGTGPEYAIRVPPSQPYTVFVADLANGPPGGATPELGTVVQQWSEFPASPATGAAALTLQLPGMSLAPVTVQGIFALPPSMAHAAGYLRTTTEESNESAILGVVTSVSTMPGGFLNYTGEYVTPSSGTLETLYWLRDGDSWSSSLQAGPPQTSLTVQFADPPSLASPQPMYGALPIQNVPSGARLSVLVSRDDEQTVWRIYDEGAAPAMKLPKLPSSIDPRVVLGTGRVTAAPEICNLDSSGSRCATWAVGTPADLEAP